jgi:hypothetical protein
MLTLNTEISKFRHWQEESVGSVDPVFHLDILGSSKDFEGALTFI